MWNPSFDPPYKIKKTFLWMVVLGQGCIYRDNTFNGAGIQKKRVLVRGTFTVIIHLKEQVSPKKGSLSQGYIYRDNTFKGAGIQKKKKGSLIRGGLKSLIREVFHQEGFHSTGILNKVARSLCTVECEDKWPKVIWAAGTRERFLWGLPEHQVVSTSKINT